jgi:PAS domain-containing protein
MIRNLRLTLLARSSNVMAVASTRIVPQDVTEIAYLSGDVGPNLIPSVSDAVYRTLAESAPYGIVIVSQEGRIVVVNTQTEKLFGHAHLELLNQPI